MMPIPSLKSPKTRVAGHLGSRLFSAGQTDDDNEPSDLVDASDSPDDEGSDDETDMDNEEIQYIFLPLFPSFPSHLLYSDLLTFVSSLKLPPPTPDSAPAYQRPAHISHAVSIATEGASNRPSTVPIHRSTYLVTHTSFLDSHPAWQLMAFQNDVHHFEWKLHEWIDVPFVKIFLAENASGNPPVAFAFATRQPADQKLVYGLGDVAGGTTRRRAPQRSSSYSSILASSGCDVQPQSPSSHYNITSIDSPQRIAGAHHLPKDKYSIAPRRLLVCMLVKYETEPCTRPSLAQSFPTIMPSSRSPPHYIRSLPLSLDRSPILPARGRPPESGVESQAFEERCGYSILYLLANFSIAPFPQSWRHAALVRKSL
ncbi:hypothetical protein B0H19DRAFT_1277616 [Mycena capillaripes]|nr:hypothetical protein B0H19DRAFT_1277616 [Mycena capillaripes]